MVSWITVPSYNWNSIANSWPNGTKSIMSMHLCHCVIGFHQRQRTAWWYREGKRPQNLSLTVGHRKKRRTRRCLINALNPGNSGLVAGGPPLSPPPLPASPEVGPNRSTSDLLNWENCNPSYREDLQEMTNLVASIFATRLPNWADVQDFLNILLTVDERWQYPYL